MKKIKISELPLCTNLHGLHTIGTDEQNRSVKVSLQFLYEEAQHLHDALTEVDSAADAANVAASAATHLKSEVESAEETRRAAESLRAQAELARIAAENDRAAEEAQRIADEAARANAESGRVSAEGQRTQAESSRQDAESSRVSAEGNRAAAESERATAEAERINAESARAAAEQDRAVAESGRDAAESLRASAEASRVSAESQRVNAEGGRQSAESARATNETQRVNAESARASAETQRASEWLTLKGKAETATEHAEAAAQSVEAVTDRIDALEKRQQWYGIEYDTSVSSPTCTRIGSSDLHRACPIQNKMRGCLLDDDGNVVEYLDPNDWRGNVRDGSRGQVMVEIPLHYRKFETDGTKRRVLLSELPLSGYHCVPKAYVSAYQATVDRTVSATPKLASVANLTAAFRGGNNNSALDGAYNSMLGKPATFISRTNFRNYARNRKAGSYEWNCMTYDAQKCLMWLFVVEYATLNSQATYNAEKTAEGYHQGGLGAGVSTLTSAEWNGYNGYYPLVNCGVTDALGNQSGVVTVHIENEDHSVSKDLSVPRYRGVENPFAHIWQWTDGINVRISPTEENGGDGLSKVFVCSDPRLFKDNGYDGYSHVGNEARNDGCVREIIFGEGGEIMPSVCTGGGSTTYFCDYHYTNIPTAEALHGVRFGGNANYGGFCGFAFAGSASAPLATSSNVGSRLCFLPE